MSALLGTPKELIHGNSNVELKKIAFVDIDAMPMF